MAGSSDALDGVAVDVVEHHVAIGQELALEEVSEHVEAELRAARSDQDDACGPYRVSSNSASVARARRGRTDPVPLLVVGVAG